MSEADTAAAEESVPAAAPTRARSVQGSVESARMDKTITVLVERQLQHPLYKKYIRRSTRLHAHDADNECQKGDVVIIEECRPISKMKSWRLVKDISRTDDADGRSDADHLIISIIDNRKERSHNLFTLERNHLTYYVGIEP